MLAHSTRFLCGDLNVNIAVLIIDLAVEFKSDVWIEKGENRVTAKGILDLLSLNIRKFDKIRIIVDGPDEREALRQISAFIRYYRADE